MLVVNPQLQDVRLIEDVLVDLSDEAVCPDEVGPVTDKEDVAGLHVLVPGVLRIDLTRHALLWGTLDFPVRDVARSHERDIAGPVSGLPNLIPSFCSQ